MKSNRTSEQRSIWLIWTTLAVSGFGVSRVEPWLSTAYAKIQNQTDVYALPSPEQTEVLSLGYRAAAADLILAHVLVYYGIHFQEKRRFEFVGQYLDTIVALEPKYRDAYRFADTLLTLQPEPPRPEDYLKARELMERGMAEFPTDGDLWLTAGQFFAYLGAGQFRDEKTRREWRQEGTRRLARACELVGDNRDLPYQCIGAAGLLSRDGEREALLRFLERVLAVNDDPDVVKLVENVIRQHSLDQSRMVVRRQTEAFEQLRRQHYPALTKDQLLTLVPPFDPTACAGVPPPPGASCASTWRAWTMAQTEP